MALQFIFGNSGSGKSRFLYERVIEESLQHPELSFLVIVPEQFTMQTQRDLVMLHPRRGIRNIEVLSFQRLAHRIFEEVGTDRRSVLTETGKNLMIRRVAALEADSLQVLGGRMNRSGYVSEVKSILSELMQYEVTDFDLQELLKYVENRPLLHAKLADIRTLYRAFLEYQNDRFLKPEELPDVLCRVAGRSKLLRRSVLALDGFAGFTPAQQNELEELLVLCPKVYMTVTIDAREPFFGEIQDYELFAPSRRLIRSACEAAKQAEARRRAQYGRSASPEGVDRLPKGMPGGAEEGVSRLPGEEADAGGSLRPPEIYRREPECGDTHQGNHSEDEAADSPMLLPPIVLGRDRVPRFRPGGALAHLEQNLFRKRAKPYPGNPDEISLHVSASPLQEVHFAARTICALVRDGGCRYRDIAVITGSLGAYDNYIRKVFPLYGLPYFLDETRHILLNPCLEFVRGALALVQQDFSCESVFRFLRADLSGVRTEELDLLENYVLAAGIRGRKRWEQEWIFCPKRMKPEELAVCNAVRAQVMEQLGGFADAMREKGRTLREYAQALWELLDGCHVQQALYDREQELNGQGKRAEASEYRQIFPLLIHILDEMADLLGDERMDCREFSEILDAGLSEARVGLIPPGIDQVQIGDIERSRISNVRVLIFLGLNDGWVPARGDGGGIVSEMEREILQKGGAQLAPSARENSYIQRFYLYQNLTKPRERLYLSWCENSGDGTAMRPSYLVSAIGKLFPGLVLHREKEAGTELAQVTSKENGMLYLLHGLQNIREKEPETEWLELFRQYLGSGEYRRRAVRLAAAAYLHGREQELLGATARALYGERMTASVTRLEQFASCAFAHYAAYGLRLRERREYGVKAADLGTLFHLAMELFSRQMQKDGLDWGECPLKEEQARMDRCVELAVREYGGAGLQENAREAYTVRRLQRILRRTVWALREQMRLGRFRPVAFEISFDDTKNLDAVQIRVGENGRLRLQGRIDRIDAAQTEDAEYVRVMDYKSGGKEFDPVELYYGLQLQLIVYLNAALEMEQQLHPERKIIPAGVFYYRLQDPVIDKEDTPQKAEEKLRKKLRPNGLINRDGPVLGLMDETLVSGNGGDSLVIPAGMKKDGTPKASRSLADSGQFALLSDYVRQLLGRLGEQILSGQIEARPFADANGSACDYCPYPDACGYDRKIPGRCVRRSPKVTADEVWGKMEEAVKKDSRN